MAEEIYKKARAEVPVTGNLADLKAFYFKRKGIEAPKNFCYLCRYVIEENVRSCDFYFDSAHGCQKCPILWCSEDLDDIVKNEGVRSNRRCLCENYDSSPYNQLACLWMRKRLCGPPYDLFTEEMGDLAMEIANLPTIDSLIANIKEVSDL